MTVPWPERTKDMTSRSTQAMSCLHYSLEINNQDILDLLTIPLEMTKIYGMALNLAHLLPLTWLMTTRGKCGSQESSALCKWVLYCMKCDRIANLVPSPTSLLISLLDVMCPEWVFYCSKNTYQGFYPQALRTGLAFSLFVSTHPKGLLNDAAAQLWVPWKVKFLQRVRLTDCSKRFPASFPATDHLASTDTKVPDSWMWGMCPWPRRTRLEMSWNCWEKRKNFSDRQNDRRWRWQSSCWTEQGTLEFRIHNILPTLE